MKWYEQRDNFSSDERILLSLLTMNEDPNKVWVKYDDAFKMSTLNQLKFRTAVETLILQGLVRMGNQGQGICLALEEKVEYLLSEKLDKVLLEIEEEIQEALDNEDYELADDLQKILNDKRK